VLKPEQNPEENRDRDVTIYRKNGTRYRCKSNYQKGARK